MNTWKALKAIPGTLQVLNKCLLLLYLNVKCNFYYCILKYTGEFKSLTLFLATPCLPCCEKAFSVAVQGLLIAEHRLSGALVLELWHTNLRRFGVWNLRRPGIQPVSPAMARGLLTAGPPGSPNPNGYSQIYSHSHTFEKRMDCG